VGVWAALTGFVEIYAGFRNGQPAGTRALFFVSGLISVAFGVVLFTRPDMGAVTLALVFGFFNMIYGVSAVAQGIELRRVHQGLDSLLQGERAAALATL
jgi:uncharacterized membrane protein HdeD (DUF308 family)